MSKKIERMAMELLEAIRTEKKNQEVERGNVVTAAGHDWLVLKVDGNKVYCLRNELLDEKEFDENSNDWKTSNLRSFLNNEMYAELSEEIGEDNILPIPADLTSLDGQKEYGSCEDKVSLLTVDLYRKHRDILPNMNEWWWLLTPWSTKCNNYESAVCCVSARGNVNCYFCGDGCAVRPFCIFNSSIFES